jgi:hypothetical protein
VVNHHAFGEVGFTAALDLDVQMDPLVTALHQGYFHQFVDDAPPGAGLRQNLLKLLIQEAVGLLPVDRLPGIRKIERHEFRQHYLDGFFPGRVVVVLLGFFCCCHRLPPSVEEAGCH